jgi:hypothetical protein
MEHKNQAIEIKELFKYLSHLDRRRLKKREAVRIPDRRSKERAANSSFGQPINMNNLQYQLFLYEDRINLISLKDR